MKSFSLHPINQLLLFFLSTILVMRANAPLLYGYFSFVVIVAALLNWRALQSVLTQLRWVFIALIIVYAFTTPGQLMLAASPILSPTYEGVEAGVIQLVRLVCVLGLLSVTLFKMPKTRLMSGLHQIVSPLKLLRINLEPLIVRLALVFDYIDFFQQNNQIKPLLHRLLQGKMPDLTVLKVQKTISLDLVPYRLIDTVLLVIFVAIYGCFFLSI